MTKNQKKSPASIEDVSEQNRIDADAVAPGAAPCGGRTVGETSKAQPHLSEYLRMGECFSKTVDKAVAGYTAEHGNSLQSRKRALDAAYLFLEKAFGRSRTLVRLYIRFYQRFTDRADNHTLTFKEMAMRLGPNPTAA